jgi:protein tyrosine/serine phosphatase
MSYYRAKSHLKLYFGNHPGFVSILPQPQPKYLNRSRLVWTARLACLGLATIAGYAGIVVYHDNFSPVVAGQVYRSAQPNRASITRYVQQYGIRTIINLRGANPGEHWYDKEVAAARALGVRLINFRMSAKRELTQNQVQQLITLMAEAPKPLLIHCASGSDRTGLASALYLAAIAKHGEGAAEAQISVRFGHLSLPFIPGYAMDRTWEKLEAWLGYPGS